MCGGDHTVTVTSHFLPLVPTVPTALGDLGQQGYGSRRNKLLPQAPKELHSNCNGRLWPTVVQGVEGGEFPMMHQNESC